MTSLRPGEIRDDRGVVRRQFHPDSTVDQAVRSDFEVSELKRIRATASRGLRIMFGAMALATVVLLPVAYAQAARDLNAARLTIWVYIAFGLTFNAVLLTRYAWRGAWRGTDKLRALFLELKRCPSCGYRLVGTPIEADGCAVCPECGAAWRIT